MYYVDRGPAYTAGSLRRICAELGIWLAHTAPGDCEAKGAIERYHKTWRAEVGCELPDAPLALGELAERHIAWVLASTTAACTDHRPRAARALPGRLHILRKTCGTRIADGGGGVGAVATHLRHKNLQTASRYIDRRGAGSRALNALES